MSAFLIDEQPLHARPFLGLGVQMDIGIYGGINKACGVNDKDLEMIEERTRKLKPAIVRIFVNTEWFGHLEQDGQPSAKYAALLRQLRLNQEIGAAVNLVLFEPAPWSKGVLLEPAVRTMIKGLAHLIREKGFANIRWLTLWNEPDTLFRHESELCDRLFGKERLATWEEYVQLNRLAHELLAETKLADAVTLIVCDAAWGPQVRKERMKISYEAFQDIDVSYSFHSYSHEKEINNTANPDYLYFGIEQEVRDFRKLLGQERELALWEFNTSGVTGFGTYFSGVGPNGEDRMSSVLGGAEVADKTISSMIGGVDGCAVWCLHDMKYGERQEVPMMEFGLWRFKFNHWYPRPTYHYFGALMAAFRPSARIHGVTPAVRGVKAIAAKYKGGEVMALINTENRVIETGMTFPAGARILRIGPSTLPPVAELPLHLTTKTTQVEKNAVVTLEPSELIVALWGTIENFA